MRAEKTVFISYRRKDISWALNVYQYLTNHDYDVFFDYTSIPSGDFEQIIISNIKARAHFLVILTPTALDRCNNPGDWLRREIETAISEKRNIIPLFFDGFNFETPSISKNLKGKLATIKKYSGLEIPPGYFDAAMERLCNQYLNVALDAILHPISDEIQRVVVEQKIAANKAISQEKEAERKIGTSKWSKVIEQPAKATVYASGNENTSAKNSNIFANVFKKRSIPFAIAVGSVVLICGCMAFVVWVDQTYRWCMFFPFIPGCG